MIRALFVVANLLSILALRFNSESKVVLKSDFPGTIVAGKDAVAEVTIDKGTITDFGRLELRLPAGITIKNVESADARFSKKQGSANWVWHGLPPGEKIKVKFTLHSSSTITNPQIGASFFYVSQNNKHVVTAPGTEKDSEAGSTSESYQADEAEVQVLRHVRFINHDEVQLAITIIKGKTAGFARYSDVLPPGASVESAITDGSSFSVAEGKVRFVWVNAPEKDTLRISYNLVNKKKSKEFVLAGEYLYLEGSKTKSKAARPESVYFTTGQASRAPRPDAGKKGYAAGTAPVKKASSTVSAPKKGALEFRVQIGAFKSKKVTAKRLEKKFKVTDAIASEMHEGFFKFMTGGHAQYIEARNHRDRLKSENGIRSAFVVAYNQGRRITVQEALMISKQKWHQ